MRRGAVLFACALLLTQAGCATDATEPLQDTRPSLGLSANLGLHTIAIDLDAGRSTISVRSNRFFCSGRTLVLKQLSDSTQAVQLTGGDSCGGFRLDLLYVSAADPCRPGGLFLVEGQLGNGSVTFTRRVLATWNEQREPVQPWITPFDRPTLILTDATQATGSVAFDELGRWAYGIEHTSAPTPPGCSLATDLELVLESADTTALPRVHRYTITESNSGGALDAEVSAAPSDAPLPVIEQTAGIWRVTFPGLDALRESSVRASLWFPEWNLAPEGAVATSPTTPFVRVTEALNLVPDTARGRPLEAYLSLFLGDVLSPYRALAGHPSILVQVEVSLRVPAGPTMSTRVPVLLLPAGRLDSDDRYPCDPAAQASVVCTVAAAVKAFDQAQQDLPASAVYEFRFVFLRGTIPVLSIDAAQVRRADVAPLH